MTHFVHDSHLSHSSALPQRMRVPGSYKEDAISRQEIEPGSGIPKCDFKGMSGSKEDELDCAKTCLGPLHHSELQFAHTVAIAGQTAAGTEFSLRTLTYIPFIHPLLHPLALGIWGAGAPILHE